MPAPDWDSIFPFVCEELHLTEQECPIQPTKVNSELHPMDLKLLNYLITFTVQYIPTVAYPGILFLGAGVQQIQLRKEDRENGDLVVVAT